MGTSTSESPASGHFETGSLTQRAPQQSEFIGSSSGVHFIRLVRDGFVGTTDLESRSEYRVPRAEDTVGGDNEEENNGLNRYDALRSPTSQQHSQAQRSTSQGPLTSLLDDTALPSLAHAQAMAIKYFQSWHPLVPFLYGPTFMRDLDRIILDTQRTSERVVGTLLVRSLIATIGPDPSSISPSMTLAIAGQFASRNDILTLQAILMAQLRCVSIMALRVASSLSGLLSRLLLHAGLHRCPYRYKQLDSASRDLRKRIFWSAYVLDRYISQALGLPPTIADSDIDVCAPGCAELHNSQRPIGSEATSETSDSHVAKDGSAEDLSLSPDMQEFLLAHMVTHGKLVSRVLEVFHKSIHVRSVESDQVLNLRADANKWFNSLPQWPTRPGLPVLDQLDRPIKPEQTKFIPFLHVLYQQLLIAIHRPYLSLPKTSAEFENSLQLVIRAARQTNTLLADVDDFFWPGYLSSAWMSGLIFTFACQVEAFSIKQGVREINKCLVTLRRMEKKWHGASRCHEALTAFISRFEKTQNADGSRIVSTPSKRSYPADTTASAAPQPKHTQHDSSGGLSASNSAVNGFWPNEEPVTHDAMLPDLQVAPGDIFHNLCWDGDFSSLDHFMTDEDRLQWLM